METVISSSKKYNPVWWQPFPQEKAYDWEVLPQAVDASSGEVILSKRNELGLLSNFAPTPFTIDGVGYASVEGFWHMMKYPENAVDGKPDPRAEAAGVVWNHSRAEVGQLSGLDAWNAGDEADQNMKRLGIKWGSYLGKKLDLWEMSKGEHYQLIVRAMREKLRQNPKVIDVLKATGDLKLLPDHDQPSDVPPSWKYFEIYTEIRKELLN